VEQQHSTTNKCTKFYKLEEIRQNSSWDPNPANFEYYLWYTSRRRTRRDEKGRKQQTDAEELWRQRWWCNLETKASDTLFPVVHERNTTSRTTYTVNPWTPPFSFFLCPSHALANEYFPFTARAPDIGVMCFRARVLFMLTDKTLNT
jgi:hypothetical protein